MVRPRLGAGFGGAFPEWSAHFLAFAGRAVLIADDRSVCTVAAVDLHRVERQLAAIG